MLNFFQAVTIHSTEIEINCVWNFETLLTLFKFARLEDELNQTQLLQ